MHPSLIITVLALLFTGCVKVIPLYGEKANVHYSLNDFQIINKKCSNCSRLLVHSLNKEIQALMQTSARGEYLVEVSAEAKEENISMKVDRTSTRNKIFFSLEYDIIDEKSGKLLATDKLLEVETKSISRLPLQNFATEEQLYIAMMHSACAELRTRLMLFKLASKKASNGQSH